MARMNLLEAFEEDCRIRGMTSETIRRYASSLGIYKKFMGRKHLDKVDKEMLRKFLAYLREDRKVSQKTIENYFSALSAFYAYLEYENVITNNPIPSFRKRYVPSCRWCIDVEFFLDKEPALENKLKFGLIGCGRISKNHIEARKVWQRKRC